MFFTCPYCGRQAETKRTDVQFIDLGNGTPAQLFAALPPGVERHVDMRLACPSCHETLSPLPHSDYRKP